MLKTKGVDLDRRKIQIQEPIKKAGEYAIPVRLHPKVTTEIKLTVEGEQVDEKPEAQLKAEVSEKPDNEKQE